MLQEDNETLRKGQLVYYKPDNMIGMIVDIKETGNIGDNIIKVEWIIEDRLVIGELTTLTAIKRRQDYLNKFL